MRDVCTCDNVCELQAEDETGIIGELMYYHRHGCIIGSCGRKSEGGKPHVCGSFVVDVRGRDVATFNTIVDAYSNVVTAHHLRVIMVNPLVRLRRVFALFAVLRHGVCALRVFFCGIKLRLPLAEEHVENKCIFFLIVCIRLKCVCLVAGLLMTFLCRSLGCLPWPSWPSQSA